MGEALSKSSPDCRQQEWTILRQALQNRWYKVQCLRESPEERSKSESLPLGQHPIKQLPAVLVKVPSGLHSTMQIPGNRVGKTLLNLNLTDGTLPAFALLSVRTRALLNLKFHAALYFRVRQGSANR